MNFKFKHAFSSKSLLNHKELVSSASWLSSEQLVSCGDDRQLSIWNVVSGVNSVLYLFPNGTYPVCMQWCPAQVTASITKNTEILALGTSNGGLLFLKKTGRIEKSLEAHTGVICSLKWSSDGNSLATSGEDGMIKIWSRLGMLRSTFIHSDIPIYCFSWSSSNEQIVYSQGEFLIIKPIHQSTSPLQWKAHSSMITEITWGKASQLILSGCEAGYVKLWNSFGQFLHTCNIQVSQISSLCWSIDDTCFCVGSYNQLSIYHRYGWLIHLEGYTDIGYINKIELSPDGIYFLFTSGSGSITVYAINDVEVAWMHYYVRSASPNSLFLHDDINNITESIDYPDEISSIKIGYGNLVTLTWKQCFIHNLASVSTPIIIEFVEQGYLSTIYLNEKYIILIHHEADFKLYTYEGTMVLNSGHSYNRPLFPNLFSISLENLAVRDHSDEKIVNITNIFAEKSISSGISNYITHTNDILNIQFCNNTSTKCQILAFLDRNNDLYIISSSSNSFCSQNPWKLTSFVTQFRWHDTYPMLAAIKEGVFTIWFNPSFVNVDKEILYLTKHEFSSIHLGVNPELVEFSGNNCVVRSSDGSLASIFISSYITTLHSYIINKRWDDCTRICRVVNIQFLWASLACVAASESLFLVAEVAYSAIHAIDKVVYFSKLGKYTNLELQNANMLAFYQRAQQSESAFLKINSVFNAIESNLRTYNWDRALSLAIKYKTHIDTCIGFRAKFMGLLSAEENRKKFKQFSDIEINWEKISIKFACEDGWMGGKFEHF